MVGGERGAPRALPIVFLKPLRIRTGSKVIEIHLSSRGREHYAQGCRARTPELLCLDAVALRQVGNEAGLAAFKQRVSSSETQLNFCHERMAEGAGSVWQVCSCRERAGRLHLDEAARLRNNWGRRLMVRSQGLGGCPGSRRFAGEWQLFEE